MKIEEIKIVKDEYGNNAIIEIEIYFPKLTEEIKNFLNRMKYEQYYFEISKLGEIISIFEGRLTINNIDFEKKTIKYRSILAQTANFADDTQYWISISHTGKICTTFLKVYKEGVFFDNKKQN